MSSTITFDGLVLVGRNPETGFTAPIWAGEVHSTIGEGRVSALIRSATTVDGLRPHQVRLFHQGAVVRTFPVTDVTSAGAVI